MNGQLNAHPLAELITELRAKGFSGSLRLQHEQSKAVIYFEHGKVIYAASNVRALRLVEYLRKQELVTDKQLTKYGSRQSDLSLAQTLATDGVVSREQIDLLMTNLVSDVLRLALLWTTGTWEFDERARLDDAVHLKLDLEKLLVESARRISLDVTSRFPDTEEIISPTSTSLSSSLTPAEGFLLSRVESQITLGELVALSGVPETEALRTIYGLTVAGLLKRSQGSNALSSRPSRAAAKPKPTPVVPPPPVVPERTEEEDVKDFLSRMDAAVSYYEVLNIPRQAMGPEIKQAYYGVARKYHPDRFRGKAEEKLHAQLESAFARITQAYETLMDPKRRKGHDAKLAAQEKVKQLARSAPQAVSSAKSTSETIAKPGESKENEKKRAEESFKEGFAALQQGQINLALGLLAAAARAVPGESRYRAYYGRALAAVPKTRHTAEAELQAAIKLDPRNAIYHVMLAELYRDLGFGKRALSQAERALGIDPGNSDARDLVSKLK